MTLTDERQAVPCTILTGFLGAGKTTLLNRLLTGDHGLRVGVLVNDFGSVNIDADLVVGFDGDVVSLANGCACCQIRDDLVAAVEALLARPEAVEYVVLEASGVADPGGIFATFVDEGLREKIRVDGIVCVLDADQVFAHPEYPPLVDLKLRQVGFADLLVLNKVGLAGADRVDEVLAWLDTHFNRLRIVKTDFCEVPYSVLLGVGPAEAAATGRDVDGDSDPHASAAMFASWTYETDLPLSATALQHAMRRLPGSIFRVKGIVNAAETPTLRTVLQVVGRRVDIAVADDWGERPPTTRIVAICAAGELDAEELRRTFEGCLAASSQTHP